MMLNAIVKVLLLLILVCLGLAGARADDDEDEGRQPPFGRIYIVEAVICQIGLGSNDSACKTLRSDHYDFGFRCGDRIAVGGPLMQRLLKMPPNVYGFKDGGIQVTLTCVVANKGHDTSL